MSLSSLPDEPSPAPGSEAVYRRLVSLIKEVRAYLPDDLAGKLMLAMFDYCDLQVEQSKRELRAAFGGRGPDPTTDHEDEVSA